MKVSGVIFDLDGTLIDTEPLQLLAWNYAFKPYGIEFSEEEYLQYCGRSSHDICFEIIRIHSLDCDIALLQEMRKKYVERAIEKREYKINMLPGAEEILQFLQAHKTPKAVATSSRFELAYKKLQASGLLHYFRVIVGGDKVPEGKPAPDIYEKTWSLLLKEHAGDKEGIVCVEDTTPGVESAKAAGFYCVAIPNRFTQKQDFSKADIVLPSLHEFHSWITAL